jgi:hypothetical protein
MSAKEHAAFAPLLDKGIHVQEEQATSAVSVPMAERPRRLMDSISTPVARNERGH